ncbi:Thymidylate kinase [Aedoeadaptatus ivorii]|uniref:Thymidylate kinase n=1 Tax=Aedoeadaptatus ivorii TaxID=54006 RepID=A0A448V3H5_9FIRM|nr:dTMP kinase [Peptoniphilus ivorii]MDQ0508337.1 dTMP kinase [Peptoniphilus ivorii]VEJ36312.1 Thymidylate kinase [Peptoniphilus ivorii]
MKGIFVVIEGPDGSGKSTVARGIESYYRLRGVDVISTREPGGTAISEEIRDILLSPENKEMHPRTEALLYAASRAQHVEERIIPALEAGQLVICERFVFSSLVYQGLCRQLGLSAIEAINEFATAGLSADITIYLDSAEHSSLSRIGDRKADRLESDEGILGSVEENYRILSRKWDDRLVRIDAFLPQEEVLARCIESIEKERNQR